MNIDNYTKEEDISLISPSKAYQWVKTGRWCLREFAVWVETKKDEAYEAGYSNGLVDASEDTFL